MILLNLNTISTHFPLDRGSAPHSQPPYISPEIPVTTIILVCTDITGEAGTEKEISHSFGEPCRTQWTPPLQPAQSPVPAPWPASPWRQTLGSSTSWICQQASTAMYAAPLCSIGKVCTACAATAHPALPVSSPHIAPDLVNSYCTEKAALGLQAKFLSVLAFLIPMARGNFTFLGHLSVSLMN